jgi:bacillithiol biosynthesis cysteine-adding enzyme BshC
MVHYNVGSMAASPAEVLDYGAFRQPQSQLFRDYLAGRASVAAFYGGGRWDLEAVLEAADRTLGLSRDTRRLADVLASQQEARGAGRAAARAQELAAPGATAIVTGQQAGLLGGPLFVLYKALATMEVARRAAERRGRPVVPIFWVASDDHDFAEVRTATVLDEAGQIRSLRYTPAREPTGQPAWTIELDETIVRLIEELKGLLPDNSYRDALTARLAAAYHPGRSLSGAFASFISALLPDLVVLDAADPKLKALMLPVLHRELREGSATSKLAIEAGQALLAAGYHQQVPVRPGFLNLFVMAQGERRALGFDNGIVEVRGPALRWSVEEAERRLDADPSAWSAGVLLRPLAQDFLLPTAAYVGGPAEIAYHAQIGPSYAHFGIPRPVVLPRPSLTLIDPSQARTLEAEGLKLTELEADPEGLVSQWARDAYPEVEAAFSKARASLTEDLGAVERALGALDPTLKGAAESARGRALHQIETLYEKSIRALKKRDQTRADRLRRTRDALFPGGALQERGLNLVSALARHGDDFVPRVLAAMDPFALGHQVIAL